MLAQQIKEELNSFKMVRTFELRLFCFDFTNTALRRWKSTSRPNLTHISSNDYASTSWTWRLGEHLPTSALGIGAHSIYELTVSSSSISGYDGFVLFCLSEHLQPVRERESTEKGRNKAKDLMLQLTFSFLLLLFLSNLYRWSDLIEI